MTVPFVLLTSLVVIAQRASLVSACVAGNDVVRPCRMMSTDENTRCCPGSFCSFALRCLPSTPSVTTPTPPQSDCLAAGSNEGCRFGDPPGDPRRCCDDAFCNFALRCTACIKRMDSATCNNTDRQCCKGLVCFAGRCLPAIRTTTAPTTSATCKNDGQVCDQSSPCCPGLRCVGVCRDDIIGRISGN